MTNEKTLLDLLGKNISIESYKGSTDKEISVKIDMTDINGVFHFEGTPEECINRAFEYYEKIKAVIEYASL